MLLGFGAFNMVEGLVNHHLLGIHHVNETVAQEQRAAWDIGFLVWGAVMFAAGMYLLHRGRVETESPLDRVGPRAGNLSTGMR